MKVLDPQSALLTNAEVHNFLKTNKTRTPDKRIGGYEPINLKDLNNVRQDFERYITLTAPHVLAYPVPEKYMTTVIRKLRSYTLTKTEALMILNLGVGLDRSTLPQVAPPTASDLKAVEQVDETKPTIDEDGTALAAAPAESVETSETYHMAVLACVIEKMDERFQGPEGEERIKGILEVLKESIPFDESRGEE